MGRQIRGDPAWRRQGMERCSFSIVLEYRRMLEESVHPPPRLSRHKSWLVFGVLLGLFVGASVFTFSYAEGGAYLSNNPAACINCHIMRDPYTGWQKASHHAVATCNDCHVPRDFLGQWVTKASNGYHHSAAFTLQNFHEPIRIKPSNARVLENNCVYCHDNLVRDTLARVHHNTPSPLGCVRCHQDVGHGPTR